MGVCSLNLDLTTSYRLSINGIRVHPYVHPQHLKVLKHSVYIQHGCGMQSMGVFSLNHDTTTSYRLGHTPFFLKFSPTCTCNTA
jgi:hypothetical protein